MKCIELCLQTNVDPGLHKFNYIVGFTCPESVNCPAVAASCASLVLNKHTISHVKTRKNADHFKMCSNICISKYKKHTQQILN